VAGADFEAQALGMLVDLKGEVGSVRSEVTAVRGEVVALKAGNAERCSVRGETIDDHEERIRKLEQQTTYGKGKLAGICTASGIGGAGLLKVATWLWGAR